MDQSEDEQLPRASDPGAGEVRYVPPSVIPRPRGPAEPDPARVRLAREIDPRQQTTRRVMVLRRYWLRHRRVGKAAVLATGLLLLFWLGLRRERSTTPAQPEIQASPSSVAAPELAPRPRPTPSVPGSAASPARASAPVTAPSPPATKSSPKPRARRVWLE